MIYHINTNPTKQVVQALQANELVVLPTDTLYALAANAFSDEAVAKVYHAKRRDQLHSLPVLVWSIAQAEEFVKFDVHTLALAKQYWSGALTILLPVKPDSKLSALVHQRKNKVALRIPDNQFVLQVINLLQTPIIGTSANISGQSETLDIKKIAGEFGDAVKLYVEDHDLHKDIAPSTIVECVDGQVKIIRQGKILL